jgi:quercetin dioxygenase-like cupin family protein
VSTAIPVVRNDGEGERLWFYGGGIHTWLATGTETGGAFLLFDDVLAKGKTTPLHTHPLVDETLYVLEGEIVVQIDGNNHTIGSRGIALIPRGVPHAFVVTSETARLLCLETPSTSEPFYRGASEPMAAGATSGPVDFNRLHESAARHGGIDILGPSPFAPR